MNDCDHLEGKVILTPETIHHAKSVCAKCGKFLGWLPKPETVERELKESKQRASLWDKTLTDWEKQFLMSVEKSGGKMSPKQRTIFERICTQYGV